MSTLRLTMISCTWKCGGEVNPPAMAPQVFLRRLLLKAFAVLAGTISLELPPDRPFGERQIP
jgi:hypothetical protein